MFLEKLTQKYSVNTVLNMAENEGFVLNEQKVTQTGDVKITLERFVPAYSYIAVDEFQQIIPTQQVPINTAASANSCAFSSIFDQNMRTLQSSANYARSSTMAVKRSAEIDMPVRINGEKNVKSTEGYFDKVFAQ